MQNLKGRSLLKLLDYSPEEIRYLLDISEKFKTMKKAGIPHRFCEGKNAALIFEKTSTRTRCAFEVAGHDLGMGMTYIGPGTSQMGRKESTADTARVLGRMFDGIEYRGFAQKTAEDLAKYSGVPVWNGLTDSFHPTQMLADLLTVEEHLGRLRGVNFTYMGDARNNTGNSLMVACARMGLNFTACAPEELFPEAGLAETAEKIAAENGGTIKFTSDPKKAAKGSDVIATDIWVSMGEPDSVWAERIALLKNYQISGAVMAAAAPGAIFMHCLPSFHDRNTAIGEEMAEKFGIGEMEVTDEVFGSSASVVFDEAENRMHTIKAVMYATLNGGVI